MISVFENKNLKVYLRPLSPAAIKALQKRYGLNTSTIQNKIDELKEDKKLLGYSSRGPFQIEGAKLSNLIDPSFMKKIALIKDDYSLSDFEQLTSSINVPFNDCRAFENQIVVTFKWIMSNRCNDKKNLETIYTILKEGRCDLGIILDEIEIGAWEQDQITANETTITFARKSEFISKITKSNEPSVIIDLLTGKGIYFAKDTQKAGSLFDSFDLWKESDDEDYINWSCLPSSHNEKNKIEQRNDSWAINTMTTDQLFKKISEVPAHERAIIKSIIEFLEKNK